MAVARHGVIEVAAQEILLKVYEVSPKNGITIVDTVSRSIPIGRDTY